MPVAPIVPPFVGPSGVYHKKDDLTWDDKAGIIIGVFMGAAFLILAALAVWYYVQRQLRNRPVAGPPPPREAYQPPPKPKAREPEIIPDPEPEPELVSRPVQTPVVKRPATVYKPVDKNDPVDVMLANTMKDLGYNLEVKRLASGKYEIGGVGAILRIINGKLVVRVGGGWMKIEDFLAKNFSPEMETLRDQVASGQVTEEKFLTKVAYTKKPKEGEDDEQQPSPQ